MQLPFVLNDLQSLREKLNIVDLEQSVSLFDLLNSYSNERNEFKPREERPKLKTLFFPIFLDKIDCDQIIFDLMDFLKVCKDLKVEPHFGLINMLNVENVQEKEISNAIIKLNELFNLKFNIQTYNSDTVRTEDILYFLKKKKRKNYTRGEWIDCFLMALEKEFNFSGFYFSKNHQATKLIRDNCFVVKSSIRFKPSKIISFLPEKVKLPPSGYCQVEKIIELLDNSQCDMDCASCKSTFHLKYEKINQILESIRGTIESTSGSELKLMKPKINRFYKKGAQVKSNVVILFGSPTMSYSNLCLLGVAKNNKTEDQENILYVETNLASLFYSNYDLYEVKKLYTEAAEQYGFDNILFSCDNKNYITDLIDLLNQFTIADLVSSLPFGVQNNNKGLSKYDILHLICMSLPLMKYAKNACFILHAKNIKVLHTVGKYCKVGAYISAHNFNEYALRYNPESQESDLSKIICPTNNKDIIAQKQIVDNISVLKYDDLRKQNSLFENKRDIMSLYLISTCDLSKAEYNSISINDTCNALKQLGHSVFTPWLTSTKTIKSINERIQINNLKRGENFDSEATLLCMDFDGFNILPKKKGGKHLKIVFVRTNYEKWLKHEKDKNVRRDLQVANHYLSMNVQLADIIVTNSERTALDLRKLDPDTPMVVIPDGIDLSLSSYFSTYTEKKIDQNIPRILSYGRNDFCVLENASQILNDCGLEHEMVFIANRKEKESLQKQSKNNSSVKVVDYVEDKPALVKYLEDATIVVHASLQEKFSKVYIEAGIAGKPIIASDIPQSRAFIKNGINGYLYQAKNAKMLASYLQLLIEDIALQEKLGKNGFKFSKEYTWKKYAETIIEMIEWNSNKLHC